MKDICIVYGTYKQEDAFRMSELRQVLNIMYITRQGLAISAHNNFNPEGRGSKSYQKVSVFTDFDVFLESLNNVLPEK
jgi:hypothetical protein